MNETQYYSATGEGEKGIFFKTGTWWGDEMSYRNVVTQQGYTESNLTDLTPVKFVPQDATVIDAETYPHAHTWLVNAREELVAKSPGYRGIIGFFDVLIAQLNPPKPRPEEPKEFASVVKADKPKSLGRFIWTKDADGDWQASDGDFYSFSDLHDIEVLFDAGQVK